MKRTPLDLTFEELAAAGRAASDRADKEARAAGLEVAGWEATPTATVLTLASHMCKWPIGDPASDAFTFCGRRALEGSAYCVEHERVAYGAKAAVPKSPAKARQNDRSRRA